MRSKVVRTLALAMLLVSVGIGLGQQQTPRKKIRVEEEEDVPRIKTVVTTAAPQKSKLEEMLADALKNNPDIRVAAANLALAEAELNRTRLQVTQKLIALHASLASQKAEVTYRQHQYERYQGLLKDRAIDEKLVQEQQQRLTLAKAKLAELEAQIPALLGKTQATTATQTTPRGFRYFVDLGKDGNIDLSVALQAKHNIPQGDKLRKALQTPVKVDYKDMTFDAILNDLSKKVEGLSFRAVYTPEKKMNLRFEEALPVSAILQALADETRGCIFYVREYGILATGYATPGALTVEEFLRQKPAQK